ncbi:MAG TPA: MerR family transcriptional regulator [Clostridia bacterium]|nr:MerR family transcriptional regulator [Clostridia bacterium]
MPDIRNCRRCGKIFNYIGGAPICPVCKDQDEEDFKRVKEFLYKYPGASMTEVSTALDISVEQITKYLKDGRLEIINDEGNLILECESCGKAIKTGRFCNECANGLANDFKSTASRIAGTIKPSAPETDRKAIGMRYLNKDEKK